MGIVRRKPRTPGSGVRAGGYTLLELLLVIGLFAVLSSMVLPNILKQFFDAELPESANQMRSLVQLVRANAMLEGKRYRIRFPRPDELDSRGGQIQPIVEVERDPFHEPDIYTPVLDSWARDATFERNVRCARVRLGKPTVDQLLGDSEVDEAEELEKETAEQLEEKFEQGFPPMVFEPDGTSEWVTFVVTDAPADLGYDELDPASKEYSTIEVILDGLVGTVWLQRPLYTEELDMMREHGWPPVLRKDFLDKRALTEDNVLEIKERMIRQ